MKVKEESYNTKMMPVSNPFFSIIIPTHNANHIYFEKCKDSIINQSFKEFEVLVVDDGSEETNLQVHKTWANNDGRVSLFCRDHQGVSAARNFGILKARAKWIMFVDADDWLETNALEILHEALKDNQCDMLLFNAVKEYANYTARMEYGLGEESVFDMKDVRTKERFYKRAMSIPNLEGSDHCAIYYSWDKVFSRNFLLNNDLKYPLGITNSEDKVFILHCFEKMNTLYYFPETLYHYRLNEESVSKRYQEYADSQRIKLAGLLEEIAVRMDDELAILYKQSDCHRIYDEYMRFCFGIISDVFNYKFFHPDYPRSKRTRNREVRTFLNTDPFRKAIRYFRYKDLSGSAKLKKLLLSHNMSGVFYYLKHKRMESAKEIPM